ncbi:TetR/AcrR family transcriptional regulator [Amycolatopsis sp. PS_44_ISF1]|uniref:TetR/AcrR family transcriptional regulator n=1 Tax=Amycolatopsis sp. PS_44_ISF1 TaxID=2974917 RepID=UPI0028E00AD2|nr:TetR/AcrR family transcriptional regulator [Amycolatopsis sp. PS_44_ISF1]MDT8912602.1 TetR/AcrR family transcriptional regulator [Amycolatopsis sp. PS_44_ISF1]
MPGRTWAGTTLDDRRAARRGRLVAAGLDLLGTEGSAAVSVRAVCRQAKLTERYFYESFADREELVAAVYEHVGAQAREVLAAAVLGAPDARSRAERAVTAFAELVLDDPRRGRVLLLAPLTDPALTRRGLHLMPVFTALVGEQLTRGDETGRRLVAIGLVGALSNVFIACLDGTLHVSRERLVAHCVRLVLEADASDR